MLCPTCSAQLASDSILLKTHWQRSNIQGRFRSLVNSLARLHKTEEHIGAQVSGDLTVETGRPLSTKARQD